jgi:putative NADPH-quinone reductase
VAESLVAAAAARATTAMRGAGHEVRVLDLYAEGFDPVLSIADWRNHRMPPSTKPAIAGHAEHLHWCDALVLVYPTWFGTQPAMLKGWIDRVWVEGVAYTLPPGARRVRPRLRHIRRLAVVTTHGSGKLVNAVQGVPGKRVARRGLRSLCHPLARTAWVAFYGNDRAQPADRARFLERVDRAFAAF